MSSTGDALTLRQLEDRLPLPYQLSSVKFTIDIHDLSTEGFDFSVFVQIAKLIFEEHRTKKNQPELFQLDWWLESSDPVLQCNCVRTLFNDWLVRLLDEVLDKTISTAVQTSENFQTFSDPDNRAYIIIETLRDLMRVTDASYLFGGKHMCSTVTMTSASVQVTRTRTRTSTRTDVILRSKRLVG